MRFISALLSLLFSLPLLAEPLLTRGPYLQNSSTTAISVRWRTDVPSVGTVRYGLTADALTQSVTEADPTTEHELRLTGLSALTKFFYSVEADGTVLSTPTDCYFTTPPAKGATTPVRFWALGDSGTANVNAFAVRDSYANNVHTSTFPAQFMMMLGDNAYNVGSDEEFQAAVFNTYPGLLRQLPLWPTIGNHETYAVGGGPTMPYLSIFTLPTAGEAGGVPSGTEYYYSFEHGNVHFVCLDSAASNRSATGAMAQWLQADLQANTQLWTVVFFHHPPYTKGSHDSDYEQDLIEMRQNFNPILESYGVDLVLSGHSHCYERSYLLDGHYGPSSSLTAAHFKSTASGNPTTTGPYRKLTPSMAPHEGAVYIVAGSSGKATGGALNHPAMFLSLNNLGSLVVDVVNDRMDVRFLRETGAVDDYFAIVKGPLPPPPPPVAPTSLTALASASSEVRLFWNDVSDNEDSFALYGSLNGINFNEIGAVAANSFNVSVTGLTPSTTYYFTLFARNTGGSSANSNIVSVTTPAVSPTLTAMDLWRFDHFGTTAISPATEETADPDGDGQANLLEYALGSMPNRLGSRGSSAASATALSEAQFVFQRQPYPELTYVVEAKADLSETTWTPILTSTGAENTAGPVTVNGGPLPRFFRLRVTR